VYKGESIHLVVLITRGAPVGVALVRRIAIAVAMRNARFAAGIREAVVTALAALTRLNGALSPGF
jgi:hypothetical protein